MTAIYRIFSQTPDARLDPAAVVRAATRFFEADVDVRRFDDARASAAAIEGSELSVRLESKRRGFTGAFRIRSRLATADDYQAARDAEERGRAGGMGLLAARCPSIWEVTPEPNTGEAATLNLCAVLAAVALGPTLPPDGSTLYGVRGAMERLEALTGASLSR
jgi:hypothetical protein